MDYRRSQMDQTWWYTVNGIALLFAFVFVRVLQFPMWYVVYAAEQVCDVCAGVVNAYLCVYVCCIVRGYGMRRFTCTP